MITSDTSAIPFFVLVVRFSLAYFLFPSAVGKLRDMQGFIDGVNEYHIIPLRLTKLFASLLPYGELLLATGLVLGIALSVIGSVVAFLFVCFTIAIVITLLRGHIIDCNCHGSNEKRKISWGAVARNTTLFILATVVAILGQNSMSISEITKSWSQDVFILSQPLSLLLFLVLTTFAVVAVQLIDWSLDVWMRISNLVPHRV